MTTKMRMRAVFDCSADEKGEISFLQDDILVDVEKSGEEGWYSGRVENTTERGLFPYNYVERISDSTETSPDTPTQQTWKNTNEKTNLPGFPSLDAFEIAMSTGASTGGKSLKPSPPIISSPKPKLTTTPILKKINTPPPPISEKPMISPTRVRSYSTSATLNNPTPLRPSQLINGKGTTKSALELALSKGPKPSSNLRSNSFSSKSNPSGASNGVPLVGMTNLKLENSVSNDLEEEDGYQMIKPSQLRQKQQLPKPTISSTSSKPVVWKKPLEKSTTTQLDVPISSNPMPRLPSRPVSSASRRSRHSRSTTTSNTNTTTIAIKETEKVAPPILKPKPILSQPNLPPRPTTKSRSTSNPPPIQPKPAMSSIEILLSKNAEKKSSNESLGKTPPRVSNKPIYSPPPSKQQNKSTSIEFNNNINLNNRPSLDSWRSNELNDANIKPSTLLSRARSATNPTTNMSVDWSNMLTKPKSSSAIKTSTTTTVIDNTIIDNNNNTNNNNNNNNKTIKKVTPPPPPPSRAPKSSTKSNTMNEETKHRYEILFDTIQDDGYVDGETVRFIWMKSKLSTEELSNLWKECDPDHKGLLDKNTFIHGMGKIDGLLLNKQVIL